jgi:hypothetical protein
MSEKEISYCHISPNAPHEGGKKHIDVCDATYHTPYPIHHKIEKGNLIDKTM